MKLVTVKTFLFLSVAANVVLGSFIIYKKVTVTSVNKDMDQWNQVRYDVQNSLPVDSSSIVFIGTSHTEGFPLNEYYPDLPIKNRGIVGNRARMILSRLQTIIPNRPVKLFIEAGTNDLWYPEAEFYSDYKEILTLAKKRIPYVYVQSIPPVAASTGKQELVNKFNNWLHNNCDSLSIKFIDLSQALMYNGYLDSTLTRDGIHLNGKGYQRWKKEIDPYLK
jgi:lysophospholipase L1-like esterase